MKKYFISIFVIVSIGMLCWAQGSKELFDAKKSEAELEIMKGILHTTISYAAQAQQKDFRRLNTSSISGFYLAGQGAVFVIPTSALRAMDESLLLNGQNSELAEDLFKVYAQNNNLALEMKLKAAEIQKQAAELSKRAVGAGIGAGIGSGIGSGSAASPTPTTPNAPTQADTNVFNRMEEYQIAAKKSREKATENQQKLLDSLKEVSARLVEALANYGDSLTQVKPAEYINLILSMDNFDTGLNRVKTRHDIISAQKSWITDYKAGRITLDNFKQRVLQYTE